MTDLQQPTPPQGNGIRTQLHYIEKALDRLTETVVTKDQLKALERDFGDLKKVVETKTASKLSERIVYGMAAFILLGFLALVWAYVIQGGGTP